MSLSGVVTIRKGLHRLATRRAGFVLVVVDVGVGTGGADGLFEGVVEGGCVPVRILNIVSG